MSFSFFMSVLASSLANLKFLFLSICYIPSFFQWTFTCWQPLLSCRPVSLSFGVAKIVFFYYAHTMQRTFLKYFLNFYIILSISILYRYLSVFFRDFLHFLQVSAMNFIENFADLWKFSAKIELWRLGKSHVFCVINRKLLITCNFYILQLCIFLYLWQLNKIMG